VRLAITLVSWSGGVPDVDVVELRAHKAHSGSERVPQRGGPGDEQGRPGHVEDCRGVDRDRRCTLRECLEQH